MFEFLASQPLLLVSLLVLLGSAIGMITIKGINLGPAAVLFAALGLTSIGLQAGVALEVPEFFGTFGLVLFTYTVGIVSGPSFFGSLKRGWPTMLTVAGSLALAAVVAYVVGKAMGLSSAVLAGTFAGAVTNTPALAAASEAAGDANGPAVGYSISYLWGVLGMLIATILVLRKRGGDPPATARLEQRTIRVDRTDHPEVSAVLGRFSDRLSMSRIKREYEDDLSVVAVPEEHLRHDDLVSAIGTKGDLDALTAYLGHRSSHDIIGDRTDLDSNRITLSRPNLDGRTIDQLGLLPRYGAHVTRVRRGDADMVVHDDFVVRMGDRLRVVAPAKKIRGVRAYLGDSERGFFDINPLGLALGLSLGVLIGLIPIPLPGGGVFKLGAAASTLIVGLIFGRLGRIGRMRVAMPTGAAHSLSSFGMLIFLAYAGTKAGAQFAAALTSDLGWKIFVLGFVITAVAALALMLTGRLLNRTSWTQLAGQLAGGQTQPAILAYANEKVAYDSRVSMGYALDFPAAMVTKILLGQVLGRLG